MKTQSSLVVSIKPGIGVDEGGSRYLLRACGEKGVSKFNLANPVLQWSPGQGQEIELDLLTCHHDRQAVFRLCTVGAKHN